MGILDRDFQKAISNIEAAKVRGKLGTKEGNKFIQTVNNIYHKRNHCGYD